MPLLVVVCRWGGDKMGDNYGKLKSFSREVVGPDFFSLLETTFELIPYVGQLNQIRKINRAHRRIGENVKKLKEIEDLMSFTKLSKEYYQEKIGPIFIEDFLNEHEDAKIVYLLSGYKHVFIEERQQESVIYQHFDTLRLLRYGDIRRLFFHYELDEIYPNDGEMSTDDLISYTQGLDIKLETYGLINVPITFGDDGTKERRPETRHDKTEYGRSFISFINESS